ncbi:MAG: PQQ-binding-like beta-propeller repeat protein [Candidatus Riflebacteria bacterium]|nr:PQQ-binding-like beta-propeller repeat protein [Candidatus Riflebacteria bacterium]
MIHRLNVGCALLAVLAFVCWNWISRSALPFGVVDSNFVSGDQDGSSEFTADELLSHCRSAIPSRNLSSFRQHPWLTMQAIELFKRKYRSRFDAVSAEKWTNLVYGSIEEDFDIAGTSPLALYSEIARSEKFNEQRGWTWSRISRGDVDSNRCENHFYALDAGGAPRGLTYGCGVDLNVRPPYHSLEWATAADRNACTWSSGVSVATTNPAMAWRYLGHVSHLLHDVGSPGHVRNDNHGLYAHPYFTSSWISGHCDPQVESALVGTGLGRNKLIPGEPFEYALGERRNQFETADYELDWPSHRREWLSDSQIEAIAERVPSTTDVDGVWRELYSYVSTRYFSECTILETVSPPAWRMEGVPTVPLAFSPQLSLTSECDWTHTKRADCSSRSRGVFLVAQDPSHPGSRSYHVARLTPAGVQWVVHYLVRAKGMDPARARQKLAGQGSQPILSDDDIRNGTALGGKLNSFHFTTDDPFVIQDMWNDVYPRLIAYQCELIRLFYDRTMTRSIAGHVTDGVSGLPIAGASIESPGLGASTDSNGHYTLAPVYPGTVNVTASRSGYATSSKTVVVTAAGPAILDFALAPSGTVSNPPAQPSITSPTNNATDTSVNPTIQASAFSDPDAGDTHGSSTWQVYGDAGLSTVVWSKAGDTANVTRTIVNQTNGDFGGPLAGATQLVTNTSYWVRVSHKDNHGAASAPSTASKFTTVMGGGPNNPPVQPSILQPTNNTTGTAVNPRLQASAFSDPDAGDTHASSTWQVYSDSSCATLVWQSADGTPYLTTIDVNKQNGTFTGPLLNATHLVTMTSYWARVQYADSSQGQSPFSGATKFTTSDFAPELKWQFAMVGVSASSPAIAGDRTIFIGGSDGKVYALDPNGAKQWEFATGAQGCSSPAIAADGTIYVVSGDGTLYALNPDGSKKWQRSVGGQGCSSPAIAADGTVYVGSSDSKAYATNPDGSTKWVFDTGGQPGQGLQPPAVGADGTVYIGGLVGYLYAVNPDGSKKWEFAAVTASPPAIGADGTLYVFLGGQVLALDSSGGKVWAINTGSESGSPAIGVDGTIYVADYMASTPCMWALNPDGTRKWGFSTATCGSSPAIGSDGTICVGSYFGIVYGVNADGTKKWEYPADADSAPAIAADGTVYIGGSGGLYAIRSSSNGLASSAWPRFQHDNQNTGRATEGGTNNPPAQPSITSPTNNATGSSVNPIIQASDFSDPDAGDTHASSTWEIYDNESMSSLSRVWSKVGDTTNTTNTVVNTSNGVFSNALNGLSALAVNTDYFVRVNFMDGHGLASIFSPTVKFTTRNSWARTYGGGSLDAASAVRQTSDGGYIIAGTTYSFGAGGSDAWVLRLRGDGSLAWQRTYGGAGTDFASDVQQTADGGFVVAGATTSFGAGGYDVWVLKLNGDGSIAWQRTYGGAGSFDEAYAVRQTTDGGFIVAGEANSFGSGDFWVLKLDGDGSVAWQKTYGNISIDRAAAVQQTTDGGFIVAGENAASGTNAWVLKLNGDGSIAWQKTYGGADVDKANAVQQTMDGGFIVVGEARSFGSTAFWVLKLNGNGSVAWQKTYDDLISFNLSGIAQAVQQTSDGGFIVAGQQYNSVVNGHPAWLLKLNADGSVAWQKAYGPSFVEQSYFNDVQQTVDGGFIVAGQTSLFGAGGHDVWVLKLDPDGAVPPLGAATSLTPQNTNITPADTAGTASNTSVVGATTNCTVTTTNCTVTQLAP